MNTITLQKSYDLYSKISKITNNFPKKERFSIGLKIDNISLELLEKIIESEQTKSVLKDKSLLEALIKTETLKLLLRLCLEKTLIKETNYFSWSENLIEIKKMIQGWRRSLLK